MKSGIEHIVSTIPVPRSEFEDEEFHNLTHGSAFPASPTERQLYYRDDLHKWFIYNGTDWVETSGGSSANLNDLANVSVPTPADDDLVYYDDATSLWKSRKLVDADIPAAIARDAEVAAAIAAYAAPLIHHASHESGGADEISITYDLLAKTILPYYLFRSVSLFCYEQFHTYEFYDSRVAGTGVVTKAFRQPNCATGVISGGEAVLYTTTSPFMLYGPMAGQIFMQFLKVVGGADDYVGFVGFEDNDGDDVEFNWVTKHAGFIFYRAAGGTPTIYASTAGGVNQTKTDLELNPTVARREYAMLTDGTNLNFYVNRVLKAQHSTNLTSSALAWKMSFKSGADGNCYYDPSNITPFVAAR